MTADIALDLIEALTGLVVQLHKRDTAARVGGAQHVGGGQICLVTTSTGCTSL